MSNKLANCLTDWWNVVLFHRLHALYGVRILTLNGLEVFARPWQLKRLDPGNKKNWHAKKSINKLKPKELETD